MARRIILAPMFERASGMYGVKQQDAYGEETGKIFSKVPQTKVEAAGYQPKAILVYRSKSDNQKQAFFVKSRTSTNVTTDSKRTMALFGITTTLVRTIKNGPLRETLLVAWANLGRPKTFRSFLFSKFYPMFSSPLTSVTIGETTIPNCVLNNNAEGNGHIDPEKYAKFSPWCPTGQQGE